MQKKIKNSLFQHSLTTRQRKIALIIYIFFELLRLAFFSITKILIHTRHMMVNIGQKNKDHKCKILTVKKWEKELSCKLEYDIGGSEVVSLRCRVCKKW